MLLHFLALIRAAWLFLRGGHQWVCGSWKMSQGGILLTLRPYSNQLLALILPAHVCRSSKVSRVVSAH